VRVRITTAAGLGACACLLAFPAAGMAKTKTVLVGTGKAAKSFQKVGADVNGFFPSGITIHKGDSVRFEPGGFHNVDLPKRGGGTTALISPTGTTVTGSNDEAGQPFWFNGQPDLSFTPSLFTGGYGKKLTYNGRKSLNSGLPLAAKVKPMTVKFTKTGKYTYYCDVHIGMKGTVTVKAAKRSIPSAKQDAATTKAELKRDLKIAKALPRTKTPSSTVDVGAAGPHGVEYYGMVPGTITVNPGDSVNFRMSKGSFEDHTATFGPGNPETEPKSYLGTLAAGINPPKFDPRSVYSSDPPGASSAVLTALTHGNGFWNSGIMDTSSKSPLASSNSVTFGQSGTYNYYCLIHPFMHGTVVVR
jgi:plastocyanin